MALGGGAAMVAVPLLLLSGSAQADHLPAARKGVAAADPGYASGWVQMLAVRERLDVLEASGSSAPIPVAVAAPAPPQVPVATAPPQVTVAVATAPPQVTVATAPPAVAVATAPPAVTTAVAVPVTTVPAPPSTTSGPQGSMSGEATWYTSPRSTGCASPTLPFGTHLQVTDEETGASAPCVVDDREPYHPGRVVDLSYTVFTELASPTQGVIAVTISW